MPSDALEINKDAWATLLKPFTQALHINNPANTRDITIFQPGHHVTAEEKAMAQYQEGTVWGRRDSLRGGPVAFLMDSGV